MRALGLVLPLYQEEASCADTVAGLLRALRPAGPFRLLLVDNGSTDGTAGLVDRLARDFAEVQALHLPRNAGYGGGILAGLAALDTPLLGWHWGDGQVAPEVVREAWELLEQGGYELVQARRERREDGWLRLLNSRAYHLAARGLLRLDRRDLNGCPKLLTRSAYERLDLRSEGWVLDLETCWKAEQLGLRRAEVPAVMRRRSAGRSKLRAEALLEFALAMLELRRGRPPWEARPGG